MTCSVEGCDRPIRSSGATWCNTHYFRWYRSGDPGGAEIKVKQPGAVCSIDGCDAPVAARGWCVKHYTRWRRYGHTDLNGPNPPRGSASNFWRGDDGGYAAAHDRVRAAFGLPTTYSCQAGCGRQARHWAYDRQDPDERLGVRAGGRPAGPYSLDPSHYLALCVPCHKRMDLAHLAAR